MASPKIKFDTEREKKWYNAMVKAGHDPVMETNHDQNGDKYWSLDYFVRSQGFHNGPGCKKCEWNTCWHCDDISTIPRCTES